MYSYVKVTLMIGWWSQKMK